MADVKNFKGHLSSSRMFSKGSKDLDSGVVDDKFYNHMTGSYETKEFLTDSAMFVYTAPLIYQLDLLKDDVDSIHTHLSQSKYTDSKQKFPVVDVTKEFYVTGTTSLEGDTTIEGFTDIKGDFKVNGAVVSNLKPSLDFSNNLRTKTLVSSSAQISSDISGSFTSLSASIATDINNAGGGNADFSSVGESIIPTIDDKMDLGSSTKQFKNLYLDGTANIDVLSADSLAKPVAPAILTAQSFKSTLVDVSLINVLQINVSKSVKIEGFASEIPGHEITLINLGSGAVQLVRSTKGSKRTIHGSSNITISQNEVYKLVMSSEQIWYVL